MHILLKTTSSHMYVTPEGDEIAHNRPSVVRQGEFVNMLAAAGKVTILCNALKEGTTDKHFVDFMKACQDKDKKKPVDMELAVDSFLAKHAEVTEETDPTKLAAAAAAAEEERKKREAEEDAKRKAAEDAKKAGAAGAGNK